MSTANVFKHKVIRKEIRILLKERSKIRSTLPNPQYIKYEYVRYADDWLVGVWGPKSKVIELKANLCSFLSDLKLELSLEKTLITNTRKDKAKFLGVIINRRAGPNYSTYDRMGRKVRLQKANIVLSAPIQILLDKLKNNKFVQFIGQKMVPKAISYLTILPIKDIILRFRSILSGILNYYSFVDNRPYLRIIYEMLKISLKKPYVVKKIAPTNNFYPNTEKK